MYTRLNEAVPLSHAQSSNTIEHASRHQVHTCIFNISGLTQVPLGNYQQGESVFRTCRLGNRPRCLEKNTKNRRMTVPNAAGRRCFSSTADHDDGGGPKFPGYPRTVGHDRPMMREVIAFVPSNGDNPRFSAASNRTKRKVPACLLNHWP